VTRGLVGELLLRAERVLAQAGIETPRREARLLLAHALALDPTALLGLNRNEAVEAAGFDALLARRAAREPLAFLTGRQGFWTLDLAVSAATLIPRADSETLIEALLLARPDRGASLRLLDLGTGTGCLLLAALSEYPHGFGVGVDLVPAAGCLAAANATHNGLQHRSAFLCGDWADAVAGEFDVILSNPPYIPAADLARLMPEVGAYEPARALDGGPDGLVAYRQLMPVLAARLAPGGLALLEVGIGQADDVSALGASAGLQPAGTRADLGGVARAVLLERPVPIPPCREPGQVEKKFGTSGSGS
jgi:release factor glutamine methyltransferase